MAEYEQLLAELEKECGEEGDEVRELGGLYVLGSERHESRRIDNQLRGPVGPPGRPGREPVLPVARGRADALFATGAMNWVMGRALPEDVPIEAKMVTKAIERAQNTVEGRNAEIRKDVLKYDEVMNEQRKVIYQRRLPDHRRRGPARRDRRAARGDHDVGGGIGLPVRLPRGVGPRPAGHRGDPVLPDQVHRRRPGRRQHGRPDRPRASSPRRSSSTPTATRPFPGGEETARQLERDIMLQIIDQRWQDHLAEMDYLREGINLRAMGKQDPLVAWQREGFDMFGKMMDGIDDDYLRYVIHVQVLAEPAAEPDLGRASYLAADDPVQGDGAISAAFAAAPAELELAPVEASRRRRRGGPAVTNRVGRRR